MKERHYVSDGRVWCPVRGDIDADRCIECEDAIAIETEPRRAVVCRPRRAWAAVAGLVPGAWPASFRRG